MIWVDNKKHAKYFHITKTSKRYEWLVVGLNQTSQLSCNQGTFFYSSHIHLSDVWKLSTFLTCYMEHYTSLLLLILLECTQTTNEINENEMNHAPHLDIPLPHLLLWDDHNSSQLLCTC